MERVKQKLHHMRGAWNGAVRLLRTACGAKGSHAVSAVQKVLREKFFASRIVNGCAAVVCVGVAIVAGAIMAAKYKDDKEDLNG